MSEIAALVQRWQSGDERAAEALYDQHRGLVFSLACALLDDPADAEEVMQEVLTYALTHIERYDDERVPRARAVSRPTAGRRARRDATIN